MWRVNEMQNKVLPIALPADSYSKLMRQARASERDPVQQARWILKNALQDDRVTIPAAPAADSRTPAPSQQAMGGRSKEQGTGDVGTPAPEQR